MDRWRHLIVVSAALGCGPSVNVASGTDAATDVTSRGDGGDDRVSAGEDDGRPPPGTRGDDPTPDPSDGSGADDATIRLDIGSTTGDVCIEWPSDGCAIDIEAASLVHGGTPLGEIGPMLTYAFFVGAPFCDACLETMRIGSIFFVDDPQAMADAVPGDGPWPGLEIVIEAFEGPLGQELSTAAVMRVDGEEAYGEAVFTIDALPDPHELGEPFDPSAPAKITGNLVGIEGDGWSVHGQFVAAYCPKLNTFVICE